MLPRSVETMAKTYKCAYAHCKHDTKDIDPKNGSFVQYSSRYWHEDCLRESLAIREIIDVFYTKINEKVVMSQLRSVINNLVYNKKNDAEYILYGLNYYIDHGIPINYPQGLYYVAQSKEVQTEWNKLKNQEKIKDYKFEVKEFEEKKFDYKPSKKSGFQNILN